jgi:hypothetical protein
MWRPTGDMQKLAVRLLAYLAIGLTTLFVTETLFELHASGISLTQLDPTPEMARGLASTISRAFNNLLAMVLSFVAIAIPITANMYTPKLIEIFFQDRINLASLVYFAVFGAHALFCQFTFTDDWAPTTHIVILAASGIAGFALVIPYYLYVLDFLNPTTIISRVRDRVSDEFAGIPATGAMSPSRARVDDRIKQLGNVVLRAVDRADRDVAIQAINALEKALSDYAKVKPRLPDDWFDAHAHRFPGLSAEAVALVRDDRTWVEHKILSQLYLAFNAALAKMPDAISAISLVNEHVGLRASRADDDPLVGLTIRYFNTFVRSAIAKRDVHAVFDVFYEYRLLAIDLLSVRPARSLEVARHLRYYAGLAKEAGMDFVHELAASDIAALVQAAYERSVVEAPEMLRVMEEFCAQGGGVRFVKAHAMLAAFFAANEHETEGRRMIESLASATTEQVEAARRDIARTVDPIFWEVTDRQTNLDHVPQPLRNAVLSVLDAELARRSK